MKRGTLNGTQTAITSGTFEQQWGLDATGNWKTFKQDNDGNGTWELNQTRNTNKANEITGITNSVGRHGRLQHMIQRAIWRAFPIRNC